MKEMNSEKEVGGISGNQKWKKRKEDQITDRRKKTRRWEGMQILWTNSQTKRVSCIWAGMPQVQKEESLGKLLSDKESSRSIYQV